MRLRRTSRLWDRVRSRSWLDFLRLEAQAEAQAPVLALGFPGRQMGKLLLEKFLESRLFVFIGQGDGQRLFRHIPHFEGQAPLFRQLLHVGGIAVQGIGGGALHVHLEDQVHAPFQIQSQLQTAAHMLFPPVRQSPGEGREHKHNGDDSENE